MMTMINLREESQCRLPNSEIMADSNSYLSYLQLPACSDIIQVIKKYLAFFSEPTCINILQHDNDVGNTSPIK